MRGTRQPASDTAPHVHSADCGSDSAGTGATTALRLPRGAAKAFYDHLCAHQKEHGGPGSAGERVAWPLPSV
jgi:hypothetical protein